MKVSAQAENNNKEFTVQSQEIATEKCGNAGKDTVNRMDGGLSAASFQWSSWQKRALREISEGEQLSSFAVCMQTSSQELWVSGMKVQLWTRTSWANWNKRSFEETNNRKGVEKEETLKSAEGRGKLLLFATAHGR